MAKKRDRRSGLTPDSQYTRFGSSTQRAGAVNSANWPNRKFTTSAVFAFFMVFPAILLVFYGRRNSSITKAASIIPDLPYIKQEGFVTAEMNYLQVLAENMKTSEYKSRRNFTNPVLAYITPWNSRGYEMAKKYNNKFTHLSPVWYELKSQGTNLVLEGRHNVDKEWILELRRSGNAQLLPRVVLEAIPVNLLKKKKQQDRAVDLIITECMEMEFDGIVLESWSRWAAYGVLHDPDMRSMGLRFIRQLGQAMHSIDLAQSRNWSLQLVYVIGPPRSNELKEYDFGPEDIRYLSESVDGFSLLTYDFSGPQNPGPNAPLKWIHSTLVLLLDTSVVDKILAKMIFLGINFYGNDFVISGGLGGGPIVGREYLFLLEQHKPEIHWEENSAEHYFVYSDNQKVNHVVFYPSLMSISQRLQLALSWGAGVSIWEIGQGLDYFFDIL
ncbi:uncharacterized protein [Primulina huaijiensis]|uniref:uncharacterized protein n=1 Tax=Primulina huaijiensis TaxID=1492673 RepID=UPI003CC770A3